MESRRGPIKNKTKSSISVKNACTLCTSQSRTGKLCGKLGGENLARRPKLAWLTVNWLELAWLELAKPVQAMARFGNDSIWQGLRRPSGHQSRSSNIRTTVITFVLTYFAGPLDLCFFWLLRLQQGEPNRSPYR